MAAKAWYKPAAMPELVAKFTLPTAKSKTKATMERRRSIEVWTTTCIVSNFGKTNTQQQQQQQQQQLHKNNERHPQCTILINPANPYLSGPYTFPYFPRGGPQPAEIRAYKNAHPIMGYVSQWGGMDVGSGMVFPAQTIDGMVHQFGGETLRTECLSIIPPPPHWLANCINNNNNYGVVMSKEETRKLCPEGMAIKTSAGGPNLQLHYDTIIHTPPPFYNHPPLPIPNNIVPKKNELKESNKDDDDDDNSKVHAWSKELLRLCYRHSFILAFNHDNSSTNSSSSVYTRYDQFQSSALQKLMSIFSSSSSNINSSLTNNNNDGNTANRKRRIAVPLLGAGCRGFPTHIALDIAANESSLWLVTTTATATTTKYCEDEENDEVVYHNDEMATGTTQDEDVIVFGLLEKEDANQLSARIKQGTLQNKTKT